MVSVIFSPCYIPDESKLLRHLRWINYYDSSQLVLMDNHSPMSLLKLLGATIYDADTLSPIRTGHHPYLKIYRFKEFIGKGSAKLDEPYYPYWWRAYNRGHEILINKGYEKIIQCDTDFFVLSHKLSKAIEDLNSGFNSLWCPKYNFPESAFTVLCRDSFPMMREFIKIPIKDHEWKLAEHVLPFTNVIKDFKGDRYGEDRIPQDPSMDYYAQAQPDQDLKFESGIDPT